jgi:hypothetical protein
MDQSNKKNEEVLLSTNNTDGSICLEQDGETKDITKGGNQTVNVSTKPFFFKTFELS